MKILIAGASGMLGTAFVESFSNLYDISVLGRNANKLSRHFGDNCNLITWSDFNDKLVSQYDWIINLAGENVGAKRWTNKQKELILSSRIDGMNAIANTCMQLGEHAPNVLAASAISIYPLMPNNKLQANTIYQDKSVLVNQPGNFLGQVSVAYEAALQKCQQPTNKVIAIRLPMVLAKQGGALSKLLPSFKLGLGAVLGSGQQPVSWVSIDDVVAAIHYILQYAHSSNSFNIIADEVLPQKMFATQLANALRRPLLIRMPSFIVKALFGEMADELLLNGHAVKSDRLQELGYQFKFNRLTAFLEESI